MNFPGPFHAETSSQNSLHTTITICGSTDEGQFTTLAQVIPINTFEPNVVLNAFNTRSVLGAILNQKIHESKCRKVESPGASEFLPEVSNAFISSQEKSFLKSL